MLAAAIQLNSTADKARNLERAAELVAAAAQAGAELVVLPEKWNVLGGADDLHDGAESVETGPTMAAAAGWARGLGINLVAGSIAERADDADRLFNTSCLFDRTGELVATYRKIHMFDVDVGGVSYRESDTEQPGADIVDAAVDGVRIGLTICYDLRFPELYRILAVRGARVLTVPSAFTRETGRDHWEVLVRARAIENQAYVIAANQHGETPPNYDSYGRSMIADPWGLVLSQAPDGEGFAIADLDFDRLDRVRANLPSLANRMDSAYRWPEPVGLDR
jgi:predicted amidohydrolase